MKTFTYNHETGVILCDHRLWAQVTAGDCCGRISISNPSDILDYKVYGPFGQGYNIGVFRTHVEIATLAYHWRDGASISHHGTPTQIGMSANKIILDDRTCGHSDTGIASASVTLETCDDIPQAHIVAILALLDAQWTKRILLFARK